MINTVIFDIGNVLAAFCWQKMLHGFGLVGEEFERMANATVRHQGWLDLDEGIITTEEAIEMFAQEAPEYRHLIERIYEDPTQMIKQYDYAIPWIKELKERGLKVYILSNWSKPAFDACKDTELSFLPLMDGVVFSYEEHLIKPDRRIFELICNRYNIQPENAVFLDDHEPNIIGAREYGLHAIHFTSYEEGRKQLEELL